MIYTPAASFTHQMLHVVSAQAPMHRSTTTFTWNGKSGSTGHEALGEPGAPCGWLGMQVA